MRRGGNEKERRGGKKERRGGKRETKGHFHYPAVIRGRAGYLTLFRNQYFMVSLLWCNCSAGWTPISRYKSGREKYKKKVTILCIIKHLLLNVYTKSIVLDTRNTTFPIYWYLTSHARQKYLKTFSHLHPTLHLLYKVISSQKNYSQNVV